MLFELDDDYYEFRDVVADVLARHLPAAVLRRWWDGEGGDPWTAWRALSDVGLFSLLVDAANGGAAQPTVAAALVVEELGRAAAPLPVAETVAVVTPALVHDLPELAGDFLGRIARGELMATVQDGWDGHGPWMGDAGLALVVDDHGVSLCVPGPRSVTVLDGIDPARRIGRVARSAEVARVDDVAVAARVRARAATCAAGLLIGLAEAVVLRSVDYAKERVQFGRPIGSFQAIKHQLADAHVAVATSRRLAWYASWALDDAPASVEEAASVAKGFASEAALQASYVGLQVHGGFGYTSDCDLHLWLKRIHALCGAFGTSQEHWLALADRWFP